MSLSMRDVPGTTMMIMMMTVAVVAVKGDDYPDIAEPAQS
jgi:hypothetical protein